MAAPTHTTRVTPTGAYMKDGYQSLITFAADPDVAIWELGVKPPGVDGGDSIDATTMHNSAFRTFGTPALKTMTQSSFRAAYHPRCYDQLFALVNVEGSITVRFPVGFGKVSFYGRLRQFEPSEMVEGSMPEADVTIECTNWDPINNVEAGPLYGTGT